MKILVRNEGMSKVNVTISNKDNLSLGVGKSKELFISPYDYEQLKNQTDLGLSISIPGKGTTKKTRGRKIRSYRFSELEKKLSATEGRIKELEWEIARLSTLLAQEGGSFQSISSLLNVKKEDTANYGKLLLLKRLVEENIELRDKLREV